MVNAVSTSISGLQAQSTKFANAAQNLANADTLGRIGDTSTGYQPVDTVTISTEAGVRAQTAQREPSQVTQYQPDSQLANDEGLVSAPNVNVTEELVAARQAQQAYAAAAQALQYSSDMEETLLNAFDKRV